MTGHPIREEDFELRALGALEGLEREELESHVSECPACAQRLAEARGRLTLLALVAPPTEPSAEILHRLRQRIREEAAAVPLSAQSSRWAIPWTAVAMAAACMLLAVLAVSMWAQNRRLDRQLGVLRSQQQAQERQNREMAKLAAAPDLMIVSLASSPGTPKAEARVVCSMQMGMLYYDGDLQPTPPKQSYQLWLIPMQGEPINAGVFNPVAGENSRWMSKIPAGVAPKSFAVTLEPAGGVPHPTGPQVLAGPVS